MPGEYKVAIVLDSAFGGRLAEIAAQMPVWIVDTLANRAMAEQHWSRHPGRSQADGVTTFKAELTPGLCARFGEFGFSRFSERPGGFSAARGEAAV